MEARCMNCRKTTEMINPIEKNKGVVRMIKGTCAECGKVVYRFKGRAKPEEKIKEVKQMPEEKEEKFEELFGLKEEIKTKKKISKEEYVQLEMKNLSKEADKILEILNLLSSQISDYVEFRNIKKLEIGKAREKLQNAQKEVLNLGMRLGKILTEIKKKDELLKQLSE